jgi:hypothetical protein
VIFELYQFSNLKVLDISEPVISSIPLLSKTDNRLFDSATYIFPLPPILEKLYAHKIRVSLNLSEIQHFYHIANLDLTRLSYFPKNEVS